MPIKSPEELKVELENKRLDLERKAEAKRIDDFFNSKLNPPKLPPAEPVKDAIASSHYVEELRNSPEYKAQDAARLAESQRFSEAFRIGCKKISADLRTDKRREMAKLGPACERRPGVKKDGTPQTHIYTLGIAGKDVAWLQSAADLYGMTLSKLVMGVATGGWSLAWARLPKPTGDGKKVVIAVLINDLEWDGLVGNANWWLCHHSEKCNPVGYAVATALGSAKVPASGPRLLTVEENQQVDRVHALIRLAHETKPLGFTPPYAELEDRLNRFRDRIINQGLIRAPELLDKLDEQTNQMQKNTAMCEAAPEHWHTVIETLDQILATTNQGESYVY